MSTKEKILETALTLFAENGYNGTSMEQIAQDVGIKAPSLYKHFKGKEDILNTLIDTAENRYGLMLRHMYEEHDRLDTMYREGKKPGK